MYRQRCGSNASRARIDPLRWRIERWVARNSGGQYRKNYALAIGTRSRHSTGMEHGSRTCDRRVDMFPGRRRSICDQLRDPDINYVSGQAALISEDGRARRIIGTRWNWERMKRYQHIAHPGSIHRHDLFERYGNFDERYPIAFDYEFLLRVGRAVRAEFVAQPITLMGNGGQSNTQAWRAFRENRRIHALHPEIGSVGAAFHHAVAATKHFARIASPRLIASARNYL